MRIGELPAIVRENFSRGSVRGFIVWALALLALAVLWMTGAALVRTHPGALCQQASLACVQTEGGFQRAWQYVRDTRDPSDHGLAEGTDKPVPTNIDTASDNLLTLRAQLRADDSITIPLYTGVYAALAVWAITFPGRRSMWVAAITVAMLSLLVTLDVRENDIAVQLLNELGACADLNFARHDPDCSGSDAPVFARFAAAGDAKWGAYAALSSCLALLFLIASRLHRARLVPAALISALSVIAAILAIVGTGQYNRVLAETLAVISGGAAVAAFSGALALRWALRVWRNTGFQARTR